MQVNLTVEIDFFVITILKVQSLYKNQSPVLAVTEKKLKQIKVLSFNWQFETSWLHFYSSALLQFES